MEKEFVPYQEASALKELGFYEYCMGACYYEFKDKGNTHVLLHTPDEYDSKSGVDAPLYQQAFRWFREKHDISYQITRHKGINDPSYIYYSVTICNGWKKPLVLSTPRDYEEAELACLRKLIQIIKEKQ